MMKSPAFLLIMLAAGVFSATSAGAESRRLLDELGLMVHHIVLGSGKRLFEEGGDQKALDLVDSKTFSTGVVYLTYQPDREEVEG